MNLFSNGIWINSNCIPRILFDNQNLITKTEISNEKTVVFSYNLKTILPHEKTAMHSLKDRVKPYL